MAIFTALVQYNIGSLGYHHYTRKSINRNKNLIFMGEKEENVSIFADGIAINIEKLSE